MALYRDYLDRPIVAATDCLSSSTRCEMKRASAGRHMISMRRFYQIRCTYLVRSRLSAKRASPASISEYISRLPKASFGPVLAVQGTYLYDINQPQALPYTQAARSEGKKTLRKQRHKPKLNWFRRRSHVFQSARSPTKRASASSTHLPAGTVSRVPNARVNP